MFELEASGLQQFAAARDRIGWSLDADGSTVRGTYEGTLCIRYERWEVPAEVMP